MSFTLELWYIFHLSRLVYKEMPHCTTSDPHFPPLLSWKSKPEEMQRENNLLSAFELVLSPSKSDSNVLFSTRPTRITLFKISAVPLPTLQTSLILIYFDSINHLKTMWSAYLLHFYLLSVCPPQPWTPEYKPHKGRDFRVMLTGVFKAPRGMPATHEACNKYASNRCRKQMKNYHHFMHTHTYIHKHTCFLSSAEY